MSSATKSSASKSETRKEQRDILRALEDLEATERTMYELDHRKDQIMTVCPRRAGQSGDVEP